MAELPSGLGLYQELDGIIADLEQNVEDTRLQAIDEAQRNYDWEVAYAVKVAELRFEQNVPATIVQTLAKGDPEVAGLELKRKVSEANYVALNRRHFVLRDKKEKVENQIAREWSRPSNAQ